jgi:hypothetical protein
MPAPPRGLTHHQIQPSNRASRKCGSQMDVGQAIRWWTSQAASLSEDELREVTRAYWDELCRLCELDFLPFTLQRRRGT